jgi:hypothetical protein
MLWSQKARTTPIEGDDMIKLTKRTAVAGVRSTGTAGRHSSSGADVHPHSTPRTQKTQGGLQQVGVPGCSLVLQMAQDAVNRGDFESAQLCLGTAQGMLDRLKGGK